MAEPLFEMKDFNVFVAGAGQLGVTKSVELPEDKLLTEAYRGAGMAGAIKLYQGVDELTLKVEFMAFNTAMYETLGLQGTTTQTIRLVGAEADETGRVRAIEVKAEGLTTMIAVAKIEAGKPAPVTAEMDCHVYTVIIDGQEYRHIEKKPGIDRVRGRDLRGEIRRAIGG